MSNDPVLVEQKGDAVVIKLNRPPSLNAWTSAMRDYMCGLIENANSRPDVKALIFTGTGDRAFCAGQDLAETEKFIGESHTKDWMVRIKHFYDTVRNCPKPVVAALNGVAAGSGFQITLLMDSVVAHKGVKMGQPEINSGIPSILGPFLMREAMGSSRTNELAITGRMMDAEEAHRLGLIHHMVEPGKVMEKALAVAHELGSKPPNALRLTKEYLRRSNQAEYERAWQLAGEGQLKAFAMGEPQAVMRAFFAERRARKARGG